MTILSPRLNMEPVPRQIRLRVYLGVCGLVSLPAATALVGRGAIAALLRGTILSRNGGDRG